MKLRNIELLSFQQEAVDQTVKAIYSYNGKKNLFTFGNQVPPTLEGKPKPYLHRIKAITGAGKTPILAAISAHLKNCIILWTTPRGAIIEQTTASLRGKYRNLLGSDAEVFNIDDALKNAAWNSIIERKTGRTIITATVASFNQKDARNLLIHKGDPSPWQQLCFEVNRPIWIFYDEGHNATENQFKKLLELNPKGFILASASELAADLQILLPGEDKEAKEKILNDNRTTIVNTKKVVEAGLLKHTIELHDLDTGDNKILEAAYQKREYLEALDKNNNIIACYIVDRDSEGTGVIHGLHIWKRLVNLGADPKSIAVHLSGAQKAAEIETKTSPLFHNLIATYDKNFGPGELKDYGFKHIIWNLSLEEGWDEPWAYVGYFHGEQANENKVVQRIGRLIRNPFKNDEGFPALSPCEPLRSVYCYLNTADDILKSVVSRLQSDMNTSSLEVLVVKESHQDKPTKTVNPKEQKLIPRLSLVPHRDIDKELLKALFDGAKLAGNEYFAEGQSEVTTFEVGSEASDHRTHKAKLEENIPTTVGEIVKSYLTLKDSRLTRRKGSVGAWISPMFWKDNKEFEKMLHYSSPAYTEYRKRCDTFIDMLDRLIQVESDNDMDDQFIVDSIKLINPNGGDTDTKKKHYKIHTFKNALHSHYNGLNDFELLIAQTLDECGIVWARNPARTGYGIPLTQSDNSSTMFYPDFVVWKDKRIFFIEAKGLHLLEDAKKLKLTILPKCMHLGIITQDQDTFQLIQRGNQRDHKKPSICIKELIAEFLNI